MTLKYKVGDVLDTRGNWWGNGTFEIIAVEPDDSHPYQIECLTGEVVSCWEAKGLVERCKLISAQSVEYVEWEDD